MSKNNMGNKIIKRFIAATLAFAMCFTSFGDLSVLAYEVKAANETTDYELYPTPHVEKYLDSNWILSKTANVIIEEGIDADTKARLEEVLSLKDIKIELGDKIVPNGLNILVGIHGSQGYVDQYVKQNNLVETTDLFEKTDSYYLSSDSDVITVLGKDSDAAFYAITTLYHIFAQMESVRIEKFEIEDWADVVSRGFIEGYYGNPWSLEDRIALMKWGGYYKLNSYFYAPKDDPKHNAKWRELYTQQELDTLIKPLADAGNESKCRFVYALHPYMNSPIRHGNETNYQADLKIMQDKFAQVISAGVRQIAILADDAANVGGANYTRMLNDMTAWIKEMQKTYPDLKLTLPFCTQEYMYNGESYYTNFPENVQIVMTGGRVWGEVSNNFTNTFTNNVGRGPYLWINWPCTDNSKQHLIMGGYSTFLHPNVDPSKVEGIVLNPMQQSEPSKVAIFGNAAYSWNIWESEEEAEQTWSASFKYVDHNSAIETQSSKALRDISQHMINQNMDSRVTALQESLNIRDDLSTFKNALKSNTVTSDQCEDMISVFKGLQKSAKTFKDNAGDQRLRDQIIYWLNCWQDTTTAAISYLEAIKAIIAGDDNAMLSYYNAGRLAFTNSKSYGFHYVDHTEYAEVGVQHIVPFIKALESYVGTKSETAMDPSKVIHTFVTSRTDTPTGDLSYVTDNNASTEIIYKNPTVLNVGDYVGMTFSKPIDLDSVIFRLGQSGNLRDTFTKGILQYTKDGKEWINYGQELSVPNNVVEENMNLKDVLGVRIIATAINSNAWLGVRDIVINGGEKTEESTINYSVIKPSGWSNYQSYVDSNLTDGNTSTYAWYSMDNDTAVAGSYVGIDLGEETLIEDIYAAVGASGTGDKFTKYSIQTSLDGNIWKTVKDVTDGKASGIDEHTIRVNDTVRYVRVLNNLTVNKWITMSELTVTLPKKASNENLYTNFENELSAYVEEGTMGLNGATVTIAPNNYIGLKLDNIKEIETISTSTLPQGLQLQVSKNAVVWNDYNGEKTNARYVRIINTTNNNIEWTYEDFTVNYYAISDYKVVDSNFNNGNSATDIRSGNNIQKLFDGNLSTLAKITGLQYEGTYAIIDLGREMDIHSFKYYIVETERDYPRHVVFELASDAKSQDWQKVLEIETEFVNEHNNDTAKSAQDKGLFHDSSNPGYMYAENKELDVKGRYLRVRTLSDYEYRWIAFSEIEINGGEYVSVESNKDIVSEDIELQGHHPSLMLDGNYKTTYKSSQTQSSFEYDLSEPEGVRSFRLIQTGEMSNAKVEMIDTEGNVYNAGKLSQALNDFLVPEGKTLASIKVSWDNIVPEITEIMTFTTGEESTSIRAEIKAELEDVIDTTQWTAASKEAYETAKANASEAVNNAYLAKTTAASILNVLKNTKENGVEKLSEETLKALKALTNETITNEDNKYSPSSYRLYLDALNEAKSALTDEINITKEEGTQLYNALQDALDNLTFAHNNKDIAEGLSNRLAYAIEQAQDAKYIQQLTAAKNALDALLSKDVENNRVEPSLYLTPIENAEKALKGDTGTVEPDPKPEKPFPFTDVSNKQWYYGVINEAYQLGLMTGATDTLFKPNANMNRGMVAIVFHRMEGSKKVEYSSIFPDVANKQYYTTSVLWAKQTGVINGYTDGTFKPLRNVSREEMATMIYNFARYKGLDMSASKDISYFDDYSKITPYARVTLQWAVEKGLMSGKLNGTKLDPLGTATRAECSKMLVQAYKVIYK